MMIHRNSMYYYFFLWTENYNDHNIDLDDYSYLLPFVVVMEEEEVVLLNKYDLDNHMVFELVLLKLQNMRQLQDVSDIDEYLEAVKEVDVVMVIYYMMIKE